MLINKSIALVLWSEIGTEWFEEVCPSEFIGRISDGQTGFILGRALLLNYLQAKAIVMIDLESSAHGACCASSALMSMIIDLVWRIWDLGCWILDSLTLLFKLSFDGKSAKCEVHLSQIRHSVGFALISLSIANQARNCKHALWTFIHSNFLTPYTVEIYPHWQYPHQRNAGGNYHHNQWRNWQKQNCWSQERGKLLSWRRVVSQFNTSPSRWIFIFSVQWLMLIEWHLLLRTIIKFGSYNSWHRHRFVYNILVLAPTKFMSNWRKFVRARQSIAQLTARWHEYCLGWCTWLTTWSNDVNRLPLEMCESIRVVGLM